MRMHMPMSAMLPPLHSHNSGRRGRGRRDVNSDFLIDYDQFQDSILVCERAVHRANDGFAWQQWVRGGGWCWTWA